MQRSKLLAVVLAALVAGAGALVFFAGSASAAEWHVYKGDVFAGHAYGLQVPAKAESFEVVLSGPAGSAASLALYDPAGAKIGHYGLSDALTGAAVAGPKEGRYVLYVYELTGGGALSVRVNSVVQPALDLQKVPLVREDVAVSSSDAAGRLDKVVSAQLKAPAVFVTLLYEGSAEGMDATVSSAKGAVMTVRGESGTAFAPGVYSSLSGERRMDAAHLDGTAYTVEVHAASFEGTLFLTTLGLDLKAPVEAPKAPADVKAPAQPVAPAAWDAAASPAFAFEQGKAYAFQAKAGELLLADPMVEKAKEQAKDGNRTGHEDHGREDHYYDVHAAISLYAPDDSLLAFVVLEHETMNVSVKLPVEGEYVAFVHSARDDVVLAKLVGAAVAPNVRELPLVEERFEFGLTQFSGDAAAEFVLARAPVRMTLAATEEGLDVLSYASVSHDDGVVAEYSSVARLGGLDAFAWSQQDPSLFRAGEHVLHVGGLFGSGLVLTSVSYDRAGKVDAKAVQDEAEEQDDEDDHEEIPLLPVPGLPAMPALPPMPALPRVF